MVVSFDRLDTEAGVDKLNAYLADKSYIDGYVPYLVRAQGVC